MEIRKRRSIIKDIERTITRYMRVSETGKEMKKEVVNEEKE